MVYYKLIVYKVNVFDMYMESIFKFYLYENHLITLINSYYNNFSTNCCRSLIKMMVIGSIII